MNEAMGWTLYVSISAAMIFFLAGYVARSSLINRKAKSEVRSDSALHRVDPGEPPGEPIIPAGPICCIARGPTPCAGYRADDGVQSTSDDEDETLVGEHLEVVDDGENAVDDSLRGESDPVAGSLGDTPSQWLPERTVGLPPVSCPPSSRRRDAFLSDVFPAEATTRPFHQAIRPNADRWGDGASLEDLDRLRQEARRLGLEQRALALRIDNLTREREPARPKVRVGSGAPEPLGERGFEPKSTKSSGLDGVDGGRRARAKETSAARIESTLGTLLEMMPRDVRFAVVADSLDLPLASTGGAQASTELAASVTWVKRMAREVSGLAGLRSPLHRVQLDDCGGERLECWLLDTDAGLYSVLLIRSSGAADGAVEDRIDDIAAVLGVDRGLRANAGSGSHG